MSKERIIWVDSLKGILILLVILGHAIQVSMGDGCYYNHLWNYIYSFHMPAFMAISGWFMYKVEYVNKSLLEKVTRRFQQLIIPYFIWSIVLSLRYSGFSFIGLLNIIYNPASYLWFLWALFWIYFLFCIAQSLSRRIQIDEIWVIVLFCIFLLLINTTFDFRKFGFTFISHHFIFFSLGYCLHRYNNFHFNKFFYLIPLIFIWTILSWYWNMKELPYWIPNISFIPSSIIESLYSLCTAVIAVVAIIGLAPKFLNSNYFLNSFLKNLGEISLGLYVIHMVIIKYIKELIFYIVPYSNFISILLVFFMTSIISTLLVKLIMKSKITAKVLLGKL